MWGVRTGLVLLGFLVGVFAGEPVLAQGNAQTGQLQASLRQALQQMTGGQCSASLLSPLVLGACQQQQPSLSAQQASFGAVQQISFLGVQQTPSGPAEVYKVDYSQASALWLIAAGSDGKLTILWSQGAVPKAQANQ